MSEKPERTGNQPAHEQAFDELIRDAAPDAGLARFEYKMKEAREYLIAQYGGKMFVDNAVSDRLEEELNEEWLYGGSTATVTGRVYLADEDCRAALPEEWGELRRDEREEPYFLLEDVELISQGVSALPEFDEGTGQVCDFKVVYVFSHEADVELSMLCAEPGDLVRHEYDTPTPEEAELRIQRQWPAQYEAIERLLQPDLQASLPKRLDALARRLQVTMRQSDEFRELAILMVNGRLALDQELPYALTIAGGGFQVYDGGGDVYDANDPGAWLTVVPERSLSVFAYSPDFHFSVHDDGSVRPHFIVSTYNQEDGDEPEYISIETQYIKEFRSTRATRSLAERAVLSPVDEGSFLQRAAQELDTSTLELSLPDEQEVQRTSFFTEHLHQLEAFQGAIDSLIKKVKGEKLYTSREDATRVSIRLLQEFLDSIVLDENGALPRRMLEFSGNGVSRPNLQQQLPGVELPPGLMLFGVNNDRPFIELPEGDSCVSSSYELRSTVQQVHSPGSDTVLGYRPYPTLFFDAVSEQRTSRDSDGLELMSFSVTAKGIVNLDGSASIVVKELERRRELQGWYDEAAKVYRRTPVMKGLEQLRRAIVGADSLKDFHHLRHVSHLSGLDGALKEAVANGLPAGPAVRALETLLVDRSTWIQGVGGAVDGESGKIVVDTDDVVEMYGQILDVRNDLLGDDIVIVLREDAEGGVADVRYFPLNSITGFMI